MNKLDLFLRIFLSRDEQVLFIKHDDIFWMREHDIYTIYWNKVLLRISLSDVKSNHIVKSKNHAMDTLSFVIMNIYEGTILN